MAVVEPTTDHDEIRRWAGINNAVPSEVLPHVLDSEPALIQFTLADQIGDRAEVREISWEEFFLKFDSLGLSFVYDDDRTGYNEILQVEERSPYSQVERKAASHYN